MSDCLHMFKGYRVPPETAQAVRQAIIDTRRQVDVPALRALVVPALVPVSPWLRVSREEAAVAAVESFLFDAVLAGLVRRHANAWRFPHWSRVKKQEGAACR
ncbi:hypothetical protein NAT65_01400 [Achromobacter xylosoxidans]|uniref:hypothetical protein n=1 Tax=Alcaligenes xylosoxydans xylosoxydans TaxID=85698 RepID=UPI00203DA61F|nr:hypothetical protein [Achromobacter xylosoxidans]MCM2569726.1 hypothetical protein [Achromobacter xylosoxidans]